MPASARRRCSAPPGTPRAALAAAAAGHSNRKIGALLFLSPRTVEWHLREVFGKLGVGSRQKLEGALEAAVPAWRAPVRGGVDRRPPGPSGDLHGRGGRLGVVRRDRLGGRGGAAEAPDHDEHVGAEQDRDAARDGREGGEPPVGRGSVQPCREGLAERDQTEEGENRRQPRPGLENVLGYSVGGHFRVLGGRGPFRSDPCYSLFLGRHSSQDPDRSEEVAARCPAGPVTCGIGCAAAAEGAEREGGVAVR
ncbi:helix-turn-helix transcriptional regulator [Actinomadura sp. PM05-2]|uniref:Helix-turn-helix transcriptional regulator n=1 Tax=Actinomadura parmotrematis TaxID=2864039 RepID=A0ABS7FVR8_9ACTN|nr:helix-turn-helix transcriptional regulator [Actinomadura parmotrematis]